MQQFSAEMRLAEVPRWVPSFRYLLEIKSKICSTRIGTLVEYVPLPSSRHPMSVTVRRRARMDYVKPADVAKAMIEAGRSKLKLSAVDLLIRGALAGAILATATSLAFTAMVQTNQPLVGALIFRSAWC
jgi:hypothetical protein